MLCVMDQCFQSDFVDFKEFCVEQPEKLEPLMEVPGENKAPLEPAAKLCLTIGSGPVISGSRVMD